jgi:Fe-S cluster assembly ATP-binding protein
MTSMPRFRCKDVRVWVDDLPIVHGVSLEVGAGERHAIMGPNGSGKSSFAAALMGHPSYRLEGEIWLDGARVDGLAADERARRGLFLGFQHPVAVPGVTVAGFLRAAVAARRGEKPAVRAFREELHAAFDALEMRREFAGRYLNDGFSGGEKKRLEILQMLLLRPSFALLDEVDSGLDIDALKLVARGVEQSQSWGMGLLLITHYQRILDHVAPSRVHAFVGGRLVRSAGPELALELEQAGYAGLEASP